MAANISFIYKFCQRVAQTVDGGCCRQMTESMEELLVKLKT